MMLINIEMGDRFINKTNNCEFRLKNSNDKNDIEIDPIDFNTNRMFAILHMDD